MPETAEITQMRIDINSEIINDEYNVEFARINDRLNSKLRTEIGRKNFEKKRPNISFLENSHKLLCCISQNNELALVFYNRNNNNFTIIKFSLALGAL